MTKSLKLRYSTIKAVKFICDKWSFLLQMTKGFCGIGIDLEPLSRWQQLIERNHHLHLMGYTALNCYLHSNNIVKPDNQTNRT